MKTKTEPDLSTYGNRLRYVLGGGKIYYNDYGGATYLTWDDVRDGLVDSIGSAFAIASLTDHCEPKAGWQPYMETTTMDTKPDLSTFEARMQYLLGGGKLHQTSWCNDDYIVWDFAQHCVVDENGHKLDYILYDNSSRWQPYVEPKEYVCYKILWDDGTAGSTCDTHDAAVECLNHWKEADGSVGQIMEIKWKPVGESNEV